MSDEAKKTIEIIFNVAIIAFSALFFIQEGLRTQEATYGIAAALVLLALKNIYRAIRHK